jgi:hypothetical protein
MSTAPIQPFADIERAGSRAASGVPRAPEPDATWEFDGGKAWVYGGKGNSGLERPVILSDGFSVGPSSLDGLYDGLNRGQFPLISTLRDRRHDLILVGYEERSASILDNAYVITSAIFRAISEREGSAPLTVGGFSMGGLVTRYALARMEHDGIDHQTALYVSYDSPHRGAWIPISLQSLAHYLRLADASLSDMVNSPAARQLLWRHRPDLFTKPREDPLRTAFLEELARVGGWPQRPRLIGVANGAGNGSGNGIAPGKTALEVTSGLYATTRLTIQDSAQDQEVAYLRAMFLPTTVRTSGYPQLDSAPGGTLESFGIAADALTAAGQETRADYRTVCFVPAVSAVAVRGLDTQADVYTDISSLPEGDSELDEYRCAADNEEHTLITEELGTWILDRLPR